MTVTPRWPAYALATLFLGYAVGKAVFAVQDRLGFPGGPPPAEDYFLDAATAQWLAAASGVVGAGVAVAAVTGVGRRVPKVVGLSVLAVMLAAVLGGAGVMVVDGFIGVGIGWQWYHGVLGLLAIALAVATAVAALSPPPTDA
jgi:hypothetical protein